MPLAIWLIYFVKRKFLWRKVFKDANFLITDKSKYCSVDGVRLHYTEQGRGENLLLLHGIGASIYCWRKLIPYLENSFRIWSVDIMGFGLSDKPKNANYDLSSQARLLTKFLEANGVNKCVLVGNSMGGAIAAEMLIQNPQGIAGLVLINSAHDPRIVRFDLRKIKFLTNVFRPFVTRRFIRIILKKLYSDQKNITNQTIDTYLSPYMKDEDSIRAFVNSFDSLMDSTLISRLKNTSRKILILLGQKDNFVPMKFGIELHHCLPSSKIKIHSAAGHHLQEEEPEWTAREINEFLTLSQDVKLENS